MQAEIVSIGTELLLGEIIDTNAAYLAQQLAAVGVNLFRKTTVGDNQTRIVAALREALARSDIVITTGGLGPTVDDVTRQAVAQATDRDLVFDATLWQSIEALFKRWGRPVRENNRQQAYIPAGAIPVPNPVGTAPAFIVEYQGRYVVSLPGVPREMRHLMENAILPFFRDRLGIQGVIKSKTLRTIGIGESDIDARIGDLERATNPTVGLAAHDGQADVRITAKAPTEAEAVEMIAQMEAQVRERLGIFIYGTEKESVEEVTTRLLRQAGLRVAVVESNTGGSIAMRLTATPDGGAVVCGAIVATGLDALAALLPGLPSQVQSLPFVSCELASAAAEQIRRVAGASLGLAALGTASYGEDLYTGTTGTTCLALATPVGVTSRSYPFGGVSDLARRWVANRAIDMLRRHVLEQS